MAEQILPLASTNRISVTFCAEELEGKVRVVLKLRFKNSDFIESLYRNALEMFITTAFVGGFTALLPKLLSCHR